MSDFFEGLVLLALASFVGFTLGVKLTKHAAVEQGAAHYVCDVKGDCVFEYVTPRKGAKK